MKILLYVIFIAGGLVLTSGLCATSVSVTNNSGEQNVWGAIYYVFRGSAERAGNPQQISGQTTLALPEEDKPNAARYLIISRSKGLLEPMVMDPFGTVGVRLISVGESQSHGAATSVVIERNQLPSEAV